MGVRQMRLKTMLLAGALLAVSGFAASANFYVTQGVTFTTTAVDSDTMTLRIENLLSGPSGTDNWVPVQYFGAFDLRNIGDVTGGTVTYTSGFDSGVLGKQVSGNSVNCAGNGGTGVICFNLDPDLAVTDDMLFTIDFTTDGTLDFSLPHLRVAFLVNAGDTSAQGDLLSKDIPVPGPIVGAGLPGLLMACGGLLALARRRRQKLA